MARLPICVPIVARNEAKNFPRVLGSVQEWVSEIVVVLNNTTDDSEVIARRFGARIERHPWLGYRDTKNVALGFVTQPWVLALDADEEVSPALREEIFAFFQGDDARFAGASFPRKVFFLGRWITHGDWYPDRSLRLFRHDSARWLGTPEHDKIDIKGDVKKLTADLFHFSNPNISSHVSKINTFADYFLERQIKQGKRWSAWQTLLRPAWRFFRAYVLRRGFLDGFPGFYIAFATAFATFIRYSRLYEYQASHPQEGAD
jgi:glycosyltransferase involved in cell wall biosynthesis